jgi:hypothetical protein
MEESIGSSAVIDLARYRARATKPVQQQKLEQVPMEILENLLDTISHHLLMAGRAIAAYDKR